MFPISDAEKFFEGATAWADADNPVQVIRTRTVHGLIGFGPAVEAVRLDYRVKVDCVYFGLVWWSFADEASLNANRTIDYSGTVYERLGATPTVVMRERSGAF